MFGAYGDGEALDYDREAGGDDGGGEGAHEDKGGHGEDGFPFSEGGPFLGVFVVVEGYWGLIVSWYLACLNDLGIVPVREVPRGLVSRPCLCC